MKQMNIRLVITTLTAAFAAHCLPAAGGEKSLGLDQYVLRKGPVRVKGITDNASGMTYNWDTKTLFIVIDSPRKIVEVDKNGEMQRVITLNGFADPEGIAYLGDDTFAVVEEGRCNICVFKIAAGVETIDAEAVSRTKIETARVGNKGLEGITYDAKNGRIYVVKEKRPRKIYAIDRKDLAKGAEAVTHPWDAEKNSLDCVDHSDIFYHPGTGHFVVLSHESFCAVECDSRGAKLSRMSFRADATGLEKDIPKAEGVTMDEDDVLYVCSESNFFYVFARGKKLEAKPEG
jgi:uncharacterized protein YjiK